MAEPAFSPVVADEESPHGNRSAKFAESTAKNQPFGMLQSRHKLFSAKCLCALSRQRCLLWGNLVSLRAGEDSVMGFKT